MNPENEGKVKLFRYGTKIFDKLKSAMKPEFDDEKPMNPFCPWEGADFKLKITRVEKRANFDKSALSNQSAMGTDEEIEAIYAKCYPLLPIVAPDQFKSYEDLEKRLNRILNVKDKPAARAEEQVLDEDDEEFIKNVADTKKPAKAEAVKESKPAKKPAPVIDDDEDSELKYFQDLANN